MSNEESAAPIVVGFWRRVGADVLDGIVLAAIGWAIAYPFRYAISELGSRPVWFGFAFSVLYSSVLQTRFGAGQTLGKRMLGIQVLRRDGTYLSPMRSLARYLIVSFVAYNSMYGSMFELVSPRLTAVLGTAFFFAVIWLFLACFLTIPLHPLKRGLHDLVSDSIVVRTGSYDAAALERLENPRRAKQILGVTMALAAVMSGAVIWGLASFSQRKDMSRLQALQQTLAKEYQVTKVDLVTFNGAHPTLTVTVWVPLRIEDDAVARERLRAEILQRARTSFSDIGAVENVRIRMSSGFHVGIANWNVAK